MKISVEKLNIYFIFLISGLALLTPKIEFIGFQFFLSVPLILLHMAIMLFYFLLNKKALFFKLESCIRHYLFFFMWSVLVILIAIIRVGEFNIVPFVYLIQHFSLSVYIYMVVYHSAIRMNKHEFLMEKYIRYIFFVMALSIALWIVKNYDFLLSGSLDFLHMGDGNKFSAYTDVLVKMSGGVESINPNQIAIGTLLAMFLLISYELSLYKYLVMFLLGLVFTWSSAAFLVVIVSFFIRSVFLGGWVKSILFKVLLAGFLISVIPIFGKDFFGSISKFFMYLNLWISTGVAPDTFGERLDIFAMVYADIANHIESLFIGSGYTAHLGNFFKDFGTYPNESDMLDVVFHLGLPGLFFIIIFYIDTYRKLFSYGLGMHNTSTGKVARGLLTFLPGLFVVSLLAGGVLRSTVFSPIFFIMLALIFSSKRIKI